MGPGVGQKGRGREKDFSLLPFAIRNRFIGVVLKKIIHFL
jgi:hypothetical protein